MTTPIAELPTLAVAQKTGLLRAAREALAKGIPQAAIDAIFAVGDNVPKARAAVALLTNAAAARKAKRKAAPNDDPPADAPIKEKRRKPIKWEDVDDDEDAARGLARLEGARRSDEIGNEMLERTLAAQGLPTTIRGLAREESKALVARDLAEHRDDSRSSKADEARELDKIARLAGYENHAALERAAKAVRAVMKVV